MCNCLCFCTKLLHFTLYWDILGFSGALAIAIAITTKLKVWLNTKLYGWQYTNCIETIRLLLKLRKLADYQNQYSNF